MSAQENQFNTELSRRKLMAAAGIGAGAIVAASLIGTGDGDAVSAAPPSPDPVAAPPVAGLHLQFGADASSEIVVSWHTLQPVRNPRVVLGRLDSRLEQTVEAQAASYTDAKSGQVVYAYHAKLGQLQANSLTCIGAMHEGAAPEFATFRTAPRGRAPFTFTSFGDRATPTLGKKYVPPAGVTIPPNPPYVNDNLASPAAGDIVDGIEQVRPLFHLLNGDLCYANLAGTGCGPGTTSSEQRALGPPPPLDAGPGNHENELGNGPSAIDAFRTRFAVPATVPPDFRGLWYAFTVGSVRVIVVANDDVALQDGGDSYVSGYSDGPQKAWLEKQLAAARGFATSTGSWCACTRSPSSAADNSTARTWASGRTGCRCSTSTRWTWWSAGTSTTTSAPTRARHRLRLRDPHPEPGLRRDREHRHSRAPCTWCSAAAGLLQHRTRCSSNRRRPGDHRRRWPGRDRQASADLRDGGRDLVRLPRRGAPLRLRGLRR